MAVLSKIRRYVPKFGDNHKLPEEDRIVAKLLSVDVYQRQVHMRRFMKMKPEQISDEMMSDKGSGEIKTILFKNVVGFENYKFVDETGDPVRDVTIQDIWEQGEFGLCMELFNAILGGSQLAKDEEKNSKSQSGSTESEESPLESAATTH